MLAAASIGALVVSLVPIGAHAAPPDKDRTFHASPDGRDIGQCQEQHPCSLDRVQQVVRDEVRKAKGDVTVELADGTYRIAEPLEFGAEDGGREGRTVTWAAAPGAHPELTGATAVTGWRPSEVDPAVYVADVPVGVDSRQLYVNGIIAPRASMRLQNSAVSITAAGIVIVDPALRYLADLPDQDRIEFQSLGDFTNRYSPVDHISGDLITMAQPAWNNNTWGWDTVQNSFLAGPTWYLENSLEFVDEVGEWYLAPDAGSLYYQAAEGVDPNDLDIELPRLDVLVSIGGTYDEPVTGLAFEGLRFSGTSWLGPSVDGYANQQNGAYLKGVFEYRPDDAFTSCSRGCEMFERARNDWYQEPAAVQVSAASDVSFTRNTFTALGQSALGIGNDANATRSGVGLGASDIAVVGNAFNEVGGHGIVVGGVRPDAHHPSDERMTNRDIRLEHNTVNRVAVDYKDNSGILSTYVTGARIVHNEVANVSYDGIDTGYGWGANDAGGSDDYADRGYYNWSPRYDTPTTLKDNYVAGNLVHDTKARFADGGTLYNLSASPGTIVERNYLYNISGVALYLDEGTRYTTYRHNVLQGGNPWVFTNAYSMRNHTNDNLLEENWYNSGGAQIPNAAAKNNQLIGNVLVTGDEWPTAAREVMCDAGVGIEYRTALNANLFGLADCPIESPVGAEHRTAGTPGVGTVFAQTGSDFGIAAAGSDIWGAGGQRDDEFGAIVRAGAVDSESTVVARVNSLNDVNAWAKSGVMLRNDITESGSSAGYAVTAVTRRNGVVFAWDSNGDGYIDTDARANVNTFRPIWVKLTRSESEVSGSYSFDGVNYVRIGSAVTLPGAADEQDGGIFSTSHDRSQWAINVFSDLAVE
ncbi:right-handed parallel beta-helix repeat-containing protein [Agromyces intestinalis]|uniref:Right-handed parallel beta-helix repeat-containing protein n=2 Tax=Agromyces intestinalis TaxID=2592652 RepID=A0A5C1YMU3_9MICO|nr:right-handed parallel beta-helix repeat-containing protein [Agromyces intestinalis]